ncbi:MAG: hypothetical protein JNK27_03260 [Chitinophagaceae bacterium]|nr:hypothetical protein [Chitinophagaceae bacterium]
MKYYFKVMLVITIISVSIFSCKRESLNKNKKVETGTLIKPGQENSALGKLPNYKATPEEIAAAKRAWLNGIKRPDVAARGGCGEHVSETIIAEQAVYNSCGNYDITYLILSYDLVGSGYETQPVSASFTDYNSSSLSATLISSNATLVDPDCKAWYYDGYCDMIREYTYVVTNVPFPSNTPPSVGQYSLQLLSGFSSNCTPLTVSGSLPGTITSASYYSNNLARATVNPTGAGSVLISTDCSTLCFQPFLCPDFGTFQYWPVSNPPNITTITIPTTGALLSLPAGTYGYSITLTYTIGGNTVVSLPLTGTFTI